MRGTEVLFRRKNSRLPLTLKEIEQIKFREMLPLQLKNTVSGKSDKGPNTACLQEMAVMFACMKKAEFREVKCSDEINIFNKCYSEYMQNKKLEKQRELSGEMVTGTKAKNLTVKQLNQILQKYPQYNEKL